MAYRFVSPIHSVSSSLVSVVQQTHSSSPVFKDLQKLEKTLIRIEKLLHDAEGKEIKDMLIRHWLEELKEVAYNSEDVLGEFYYELLRCQIEGTAKASDLKQKQVIEAETQVHVSTSASDVSFKEVIILVGMEEKIKEIIARYEEIVKAKNDLHLTEYDAERRNDGRAKFPLPTSSLMNQVIFGREQDKENLIEWLFIDSNSSSSICVNAIVGKGGLGKTTVAQMVYNDPKISNYFDHKIWICVSEDFNIQAFTKTMLEAVTLDSCTFTELDLLQTNLNRRLKDKRIFLVLDDVWNDQKEPWEMLKIPLLAAKATKVLVTTRNLKVAEIMKVKDPYMLELLPEEECHNMFQYHAFDGRNINEYPYLVDIGKLIVKKCAGLPLAVKALGRLVQLEDEEEEWNDVLHSELWELEEDDKDLEIMPALRVSYSRMPTKLKPCYLYCSMFPKDYEFTKDKLVRLWMVQGYIIVKPTRSYEDAGSVYFDELQRRSFLDFSHYKDDGDRIFKMHDIIHDLAQVGSRNESRAVLPSRRLPVSENVRHLYVEGQKELIDILPEQNLDARRTLLVHDLQPSVCPLILFQMLNLRALDFSSQTVYDFPIVTMKHLRYLRIKSKNIERLPETVSTLYNLQVLDLSGCSKLKELPEGIGKLVNLQILCLNDCRGLPELPSGIGVLFNLRNLQLLDVSFRLFPASIEWLTNLEKLDYQRA